MPKHSSEYPIDLPIERLIWNNGCKPGEQRHGLGILLKAFVGEDIGVRKSGDDDVERFAEVRGLVVGVLHPKERR